MLKRLENVMEEILATGGMIVEGENVYWIASKSRIKIFCVTILMWYCVGYREKNIVCSSENNKQ